MQQIEFDGIIITDPVTYDCPKGDQRDDNPDYSYCYFKVLNGRIKRHGVRKKDVYAVRCYTTRRTRNGEICQKYCFKGQPVFVMGELQPEMIERPEGTVDMVLGVRASYVRFLAREKDIIGRVMVVVEDEQEVYPDIEQDMVDWDD